MSPFELAGRLALAIVVTLLATRGVAMFVRRGRQPPVVGEILAGIALGPTLLGALPGDPSKFIFPSQVVHTLTTVGQIGVVLYLFLVGLDLGVSGATRSGRTILAISLSSLVVPFGLGILLASHLYHSHSVVAGTVVGRLPFMLFLGTAFAMTALPVLARILTDTGLHRNRLGGLAIGCAAILDALGWIMLALALAVAHAKGPGSLARLIAEGVGFVVLMLVVVRPLLGRVVARQPSARRAGPAFAALIVALIMCSAAVTQAIGLHALFGAVLFGAAYPRRRNPSTAPALEATLRPVTVSLILPFFFLIPGLHLNLRHLGGGAVTELALILLVACGGKFVGAGFAARARGFSWRDATVMGTLMNTRGLIELVVLSAGLSAHVLDNKLYGLMVVMAVATTMMTGPILSLIYGPMLARRPAAGVDRWLIPRVARRVSAGRG